MGLLPRQEKRTVTETDVALGGAAHGAGAPDGGRLSSATGGLSPSGSAAPGPLSTLPVARREQSELVEAGRGT